VVEFKTDTSDSLSSKQHISQSYLDVEEFSCKTVFWQESFETCRTWEIVKKHSNILHTLILLNIASTASSITASCIFDEKQTLKVRQKQSLMNE